MPATAADTREIIDELKKRRVRFLLLQFTDLLGVNKAVEVPSSQFERALAGEVTFDGSALEGFARVEEADALLVPDLETFRVFPWDSGTAEGGDGEADGAVARLICDIGYPDGRSFEGCPRTTLKRQIERAAKLGFTMRVGCEVEFFIFEQSERGEPTTRTLEAGSYFDLVPVDRGEQARRAIVAALEHMKLGVEASHHEVAPGQHEIDLSVAEPLTMADQWASLRFIARTIAVRHGLVATFMPKPIYGRNGSGMHTHQSLFAKGKNAFFHAQGPIQLSEVGRWYIGGLLRHARGYCAVTHPLVNSYKRLGARDLHEALDYLEKDAVVREALGEHICERYLDAKREEWQEYIGQVGEWELNRYLGQY